MLETFADPNAWIALATLTALEIVLGIDNIIFISILAGKLPKEQQATARTGHVDAHRPALLPDLGHAAHEAALHRPRL